MSTIVVSVRQEVPDIGLLRALGKMLPRALGDLSGALKAGAPLLQSRLFFNDHEERAAELRALLRLLSESGAAVDVFAVEEDESGPSDTNRVGVDGLLEILDDWDQTVLRIRQRDDLGGRDR
ncbi:MAG: hypothetical protein Q8L14_40750 [Myxococcales bacterium]|nr:hypothetical protein [Myxococcales bacterium]